MFLPDFILLRKIKVQHVYCDRKSLENFTGITKTKYKLAGNVITSLKIYTFFVATTNELACQRALTVQIQNTDWEQAVPGHLQSPISYIDITKVTPITEQELLNKIKDKTNGFPWIAKLCDTKFQELKALRNKAHTSRHTLPLEKTALVRVALDDVVDLTQLSQDVIDRLGLN